ncbi:class I SAM-dependent methyltransferase [Bradyrhizobium prioriisuperbiae]|uniref:class I SAM-dependent methyltransferase n=1 Tax=Bradyrhizobium prioriisuperbiae TaxID=2854389 RepID=UPI0028E72DCA|nr:class I SAM-dependent methyltransferase [Bradyrhizobium prioritasuperba]
MDMMPSYRMSSLRQGLQPQADAPTTEIADQPQALLDLPDGDAKESLRAVHAVLNNALAQPTLAIYEAGGGSTCFLPPSLLRRADVTVVDIDKDQLANNDYAQHKILADIQTHRFPHDCFDLVICYNVIEHLPDVEAALRRFSESLRRGGVILIGAPNPASLSGVVTRFSPHWFHVWYYRHIRGIKDAGQPGHAPFPVCYHPLVWLDHLKAFARGQGLEVLFERTYESPRYGELRDSKPWLGAIIDAGAAILNIFSKSDVRRGDYHLVLRRS